ncbi:LOW QUALITY PROTEIN: cytochrome P450 27C1-like [Hyla sarda]|uniref:LOW QUALITY PROTEIN: cytochrome P450 27C1-like n=1 Tax=Hyla sarda TaxID=327740 RepID=UPI0024C2CBB2|nr:LOW QUALITY PROTEIN: cytochrome P450 27C1-like [Hyla sarda]
MAAVAAGRCGGRRRLQLGALGPGRVGVRGGPRFWAAGPALGEERAQVKSLREMPGPRTLTNLREFFWKDGFSRIHEIQQKHIQEYGRIFKSHFGPQFVVSIADRDMVAQVLRAERDAPQRANMESWQEYRDLRGRSTGLISASPLFPQTQLALCHYSTSYDEGYFPTAEEFQPSRWLRNGHLDRVENFGSIPFGYGIRSCIGRRVAELEIHLALTQLLQKFQIKTSPKTQSVLPKTHGLLCPAGAINVRYVDRE